MDSFLFFFHHRLSAYLGRLLRPPDRVGPSNRAGRLSQSAWDGYRPLAATAQASLAPRFGRAAQGLAQLPGRGRLFVRAMVFAVCFPRKATGW